MNLIKTQTEEDCWMEMWLKGEESRERKNRTSEKRNDEKNGCSVEKENIERRKKKPIMTQRFKNPRKSWKTRPDTPHKMRLVCVHFTIENNTGHTDLRRDGGTDTTSYKDATAHLKMRLREKLRHAVADSKRKTSAFELTRASGRTRARTSVPLMLRACPWRALTI